MADLEFQVIDNPAITELHRVIGLAANKAAGLGLPPMTVSSILGRCAADGMISMYGEAGAKALCDLVMARWHEVKNRPAGGSGRDEGGERG